MATMNHDGMNGINAGGPMAMTNGANPAATQNVMPAERDNEMKMKLNAYIYDYLLKNEQWEVARALHKSSLTIRYRKGDGDSMEDSKDDIELKKPPDLPMPGDVPTMANDNSFLFDWFSIFWDIFLAPRTRNNPGVKQNPALQFMENAKVCTDSCQTFSHSHPAATNPNTP